MQRKDHKCLKLKEEYQDFYLQLLVDALSPQQFEQLRYFDEYLYQVRLIVKPVAITKVPKVVGFIENMSFMLFKLTSLELVPGGHSLIENGGFIFEISINKC